MVPGSRRAFLKKLLLTMGATALSYCSLPVWVQSAAAKLKRQILAAGTSMVSLINKNPRFLDTRILRPIPLDQFGTMGLNEFAFDPQFWRLEVIGQVKNPLSLSKTDILKLPTIERNILMICPGVFANFGSWEGISIGQLLKSAQADARSKHITIRGPKGPDAKSKRFPISDINDDKVFLAYKINGQELPQKHGHPIRAVAEGYFGFDWIKFVHQIEVDEI
jgi:sulfoxide reductase catalytic subunit YedY